jgi:hypothetical protein
MSLRSIEEKYRQRDVTAEAAARSTEPPAGWSIVEYRGRDGLLQLEADWRRLYAAMSRHSYHQAYEACLAYLDHLAPEPDEFLCLALSDGPRVRAICPVEKRIDRSLHVPLRVWGSPSRSHWPLADVICPDDEARHELVPALADFLRRAPYRRGLLVLGPLPARSAANDGLVAMGRGEYYDLHVQDTSFVDCHMKSDELAAGRSKLLRSDLRKAHRRLANLEDTRFVTAAKGDDLAREVGAFLDVEASGWKGEAGTRTAIALDPRLTAFYRALSTMQGDHVRCELNAVYTGDRCIASQFCVRTREEYAVLKIGYDETFKNVSPGNLLLEYTLERCSADPTIERVNLVSRTPRDSEWNAYTVPMHQLYIATSPWSGRVLLALLRFRFGLVLRMGRRVREPLAKRPKKGA